MLTLGNRAQRVAVIDYKAGNLRNISKAVSAVGCDVLIADRPAQLKDVDKILIPGMGAAGNALTHLKNTELFDAIIKNKQASKGIIGICLGFHLFYRSLAEADGGVGFEYFPDDVVHLNKSNIVSEPIPNLGWLKVHSFFEDEMAYPWQDKYFYFAHSFTPEILNCDTSIGFSRFGRKKIVSVARSDNVIGCQFHPEKSGVSGLEFLKWQIDQV